MTVLSDEEIEKWKSTFAAMEIVYGTDAEYREAIMNLVGYFELLIEMDVAQRRINAPGER